MQLKRLALKAYRNLQKVDINFAEEFVPSPDTGADKNTKRISSHALIGQNGTGKSNLMEAVITIFRDVDLDRDA